MNNYNKIINKRDYKYTIFHYNKYKVKVWYKSDFTVNNIESLTFNILNKKVPSNTLHDIRNKIQLICSDNFDFINQDIVVKHFCLGRKYDQLRFRFLNSKAFRSINMAIKMKEVGINTPEPLMAVEFRGKLNKLVRSFYISAYVDYDYNLLTIIRDNSHPLRNKIIEFLPQIAKDIRKMHDTGIIHNDMHAGNILLKNIEKEPDFYYIDLNRAREKKGLSLKVRMKDLARFDLTEKEMKVFLKNYAVKGSKCNRYLRELKRQRNRKVKINETKKLFRSILNKEIS